MGQFSEQLKKYLDSPEGAESIERYNKYLQHCREINYKYIEKFNNFPRKKKIELLNRIKGKYETKEYCDRFYKKGTFPRYPLYELLLSWCEMYCPRVLTTDDRDDSVIYDILEGVFLFKYVSCGFDSLFSLEEPKQKIIPHDFTEINPSYTLYDDNNIIICCTTNKQTIFDCLKQIGKHKLEGYTVEFENKIHNIAKNGLVHDIEFYNKLTDFLK